MLLFPISNDDADFGLLKLISAADSDIDVCVLVDILAHSVAVFISLFLVQFELLGVQPLLEKGDGESWVPTPTTSNGWVVLDVEGDDDKFDDDVDIDNAIEDDA